MEKQIRITIRLSSSTYAKLLRLAANYEGNASMTIRKLIEKEIA
jgi:predicted DNA-binding protein